MSQRQVRRTAASAAGVTALCATALLAAAPATAEPGGNVVFRNHFTFDESHIEQVEHPGEFCDVPYLVLWEGHGTVTDMESVRRGDRYFVSFKVTQMQRWTNVETGASFFERTHFGFRDQKVDIDDDGILTATVQDHVSWKLFDGDGKLLGVDAGVSSTVYTVDLGDLTDPDDDVELSAEPAGDHGTRQLGQRDFCADVETFLG